MMDKSFRWTFLLSNLGNLSTEKKIIRAKINDWSDQQADLIKTTNSKSQAKGWDKGA